MRPAPTKSTSPLVEALKHYDRHDRRRFHVPAHAGQSLLGDGAELLGDPFRYDLTELDGLDVLSEPSGVIGSAQARMAELFGVAHSFMLVNGASVGLMAAMLSVVQPGQKVLIPRNAHRSVLSGLILTGAEPVWFLPERLPDWGLWGGITVEQVRSQLALHPDSKALFVTAPTYEGIGSDIQGIAALCRDRNVLLVVDEAHGSLWPLSAQLPPSACQSGADIVIHSLHKSGGSLTQSALAHLPVGSRVDPAVYQQALNTLQTTSPSYLLMASLDAACGFLSSEQGAERIAWLLDQVGSLRIQLKGQLGHLRLFEADHPFWDPCKIYVKHPVESGEDWGARLEEDAQIAYESASPEGVLYLANLGLAAADFEAFQQVLLAEDAALNGKALNRERPHAELTPELMVPGMRLLPREAFFQPGETVSGVALVGRIAKETVVHCPPGIPVLVPGEEIRPVHLPYLLETGVLVVR